MSICVYIDGYNFYYGELQGTPYRWLDLDAFCRRVVGVPRIDKIRYFTAPVAVLPGETDVRKPIRQQIYLNALATLPNVEIHLGYFSVKSATRRLVTPLPGGKHFVKVFHVEEKGSDVNLGAYLIRDAFRNEYDTAVVVSNDTDLLTPIKIVRSELGKQVGIVNPNGLRDEKCKHSALVSAADFQRKINKREVALAACQFPEQIVAPDGTIIERPFEWAPVTASTK
ncbi:MAG: NYN domain-containing protein [Armatimonadota bacterium]